MFEGIKEREFVEQSILDLKDAAENVKQGIANVTRTASQMKWQGEDRRDFDEKQAAFLVELRQVEQTLRTTAAELTDILRTQIAASGS